jgi:putative transposase
LVVHFVQEKLFSRRTFLICLTFSRQESVRLYKRELNPKVKERLLMVLRVVDDGILPAHAADELHRSRPWALYWLDRFSKEGIDGLKDRSKSGRPPEIPEELAIRIRRELLESKQGWTTKQVSDMIFREGGVRYHYTHIYRILHKWGFKQKVPRKRHINTASVKEKEDFKKEPRKYWTLYQKDLQ